MSERKYLSYLLRIAAYLKKYLPYLLGIAVSLAVFSVILLAFGYNPIISIEGLVSGSFGSTFLASESFVLMAPFLLAALSFLVAFLV